MSERIIPQQFRESRIAQFGDKGKKWVDSIPDLISEFEKKWDIKVQEPFPNLSFNYVAPTIRSNQTHAVLKICIPNKEFYTELNALRAFNGEGMIRLLESDENKMIMLLEKVEPGMPLSKIKNDEEAIRVAAAVMKRLWRPAVPSYRFPCLADWGKGFSRLRQRYNGATGPLPYGLVEHAERIFQKHTQNPSKEVLLHGDLHHDNIRSSHRDGWLAIDPKGITGEPEYETSAFTRNNLPPTTDKNILRSIIEKRVSIFANDLGFTRQSIYEWSLAQNVLSAWWTIEDNGEDFSKDLLLASIIAELL